MEVSVSFWLSKNKSQNNNTVLRQPILTVIVRLKFSQQIQINKKSYLLYTPVLADKSFSILKE